MSSDRDKYQELRLPGMGISLAGCLWHPDRPQPFVALHGWLDNAASLEPLAKELDELQMLALDLAGHGHSDFRSEDATYDLTRDVADIHGIIQEMNWGRFGLIGHSRGAMVAVLYTAAFPDHVSHLVLIDGGGRPFEVNPDELPQRLARSIREQKSLAGKTGSLFRDRESALHARADGFVPVGREVAELLASRALVADQGGFRWHADQRVKVTTSNPLDSSSVSAYFAALRCPVLQILGRDGMVATNPVFGGPVEGIETFTQVTLEGDHHLHIGQVKQVATAIRDWLDVHPIQN